MTEPAHFFREIPKSTLIKWALFLIIVYALYDGVYLWADSLRLMLDMSDVTSGLVPILIAHIDLPLLLGSILICVIFARRQAALALAIRSKGQMLWMVFGALIFLVAVYIQQPAGAVAGYEIVHALVIAGLLEELLFRGIFFVWLDQAGCGVFSYLISGLAWGAHYSIRTIVVNNTMTLWAVLPVALFGVVIGSVAAFIYKKSNSLWFVAYLHGALSLF